MESANNFPKVSDAMQGNALNRAGLGPSEDPRAKGDGLDLLTIWGLQDLCAAHGMVEALGEGKHKGGDSTEWTADYCKKRLRALDITTRTAIPKKAKATAEDAPKNKGGRPKKTDTPAHEPFTT